jgi:dTDP-glucose 4,6-dehydratase
MSSTSTILVTGASGFIGSHLVEHLAKKGYTVRAFVRYNSKNSWGWLDNSPQKNKLEIISGDIRDYDSVCKAVKGCSAVFHLAALIGIPYSYLSPLGYIKTNIEGTYNILESAKNCGIEQVLITSTSETYGTARYVPIDEEHPVVGQSPYSASKIAADQLAVSYYRSFNLPVKIVRPFNTYGPRQSARGIIPTIISQILAGSATIKIGNIHPTRDFTYVNDTVNAFMAIYNTPELLGQAVNIGTGKECSIGALAQIIIELLDAPVTIDTDQERIRPQKSEVERLNCNNTKLQSATNWKPSIPLKEGLTHTISWIKNNTSIYKSSIYNV